MPSGSILLPEPCGKPSTVCKREASLKTVGDFHRVGWSDRRLAPLTYPIPEADCQITPGDLEKRTQTLA